ncbi:MAG: YncE family protein [Verrucomicrobia bacterium]|nr:YncE family protein [Verrucomicrobiota bacterium]
MQLFKQQTVARLMCLRLVFGMGVSGSMMMASSGLAQPADSIGIAATGTSPKNTVITTVQLGVDQTPSAIVVSPDNKTVYVATEYENVAVLDATNNYMVKATISLPGTVSDYLAISPDGTTLYVGGYATPPTGIVGNVSVIDTTQPTYPVKANLVINGFAKGLAVTLDGKSLYVPYSGYSESTPGGVEIFDMSKNVGTTIQTGGEPFEFILTEEGKQADLLNGGGTGYLQFINTVTGTLSRSTVAGGRIFFPLGMTTDASGSTLYIASDLNYVTVCNAKTGAVIKRFLVSPNIASQTYLGQTAVTPDGRYMYVPYAYNYTLREYINQVAMFDVGTGKIVGSPIQVGSYPVWAQMAPNGDTLYVANSIGGSVTVVDTTP